jgi:hypothetical protein
MYAIHDKMDILIAKMNNNINLANNSLIIDKSGVINSITLHEPPNDLEIFKSSYVANEIKSNLLSIV